MKRRMTLALVVIGLMIATRSFCPEEVSSAPKAEDDFQLVKVADGVYDSGLAATRVYLFPFPFSRLSLSALMVR